MTGFYHALISAPNACESEFEVNGGVSLQGTDH